MEDYEKRKERLKAMRTHAAQGGVIAQPEGSGLGSDGLYNPLIQSETLPSPYQQTSRRFDFYTDPMAAFSGNARTSNVYPVPQQHYNAPRQLYQGMTQTPLYQNPAVHSPGSGIFQGPRAHSSQSYLGSPMIATPYERMPQVPGAHSSHSYHGSPMGVTPRGGTMHVMGAHSSQSYHGSTTEETKSWVRPQGNPPPALGGSGGTLNYGAPANQSPRVNFVRAGFGQGDSPHATYNQGRGDQRYNTSFHHDSGRGRARQPSVSSSPGSGPSGWRATGSHHSVSAKERPDLYYSKKMIEDPWKQLTPALWVSPLSRSAKFWPKSITNKKPKVCPEASKLSIPRTSLAQYLAEAFNDPIDEAVEDSKCST